MGSWYLELDQEVKLRSQASGRFINDCAQWLCVKVEFQSMSARLEGTFIPDSRQKKYQRYQLFLCKSVFALLRQKYYFTKKHIFLSFSHIVTSPPPLLLFFVTEVTQFLGWWYGHLDCAWGNAICCGLHKIWKGKLVESHACVWGLPAPLTLTLASLPFVYFCTWCIVMYSKCLCRKS